MSDIQMIEERLGIRFPEYYSRFHREERALIHEMRASDSAPEDHSICLATDPNTIVEANELGGLPCSDGPLRGKIIIGSDGCGNFSLLNLDDPDDRTIYFIDHDGYEYDEIFNQAANDFDWSHPGLQQARNLRELIQNQIRLNKESKHW